MSKKKVLFVDDDPVALRLVVDEFKSRFGTENVQYEMAADALEAEEIILDDVTRGNAPPTMIVCDWMMPQKRGDDFLREIHKLYPDIKLVLHSGLADETTESVIRRDAQLLCSIPKPWDGVRHADVIAAALS
ncbi:MAG: response regulator [Bacteroidia bacterium]|nr:response regulator [Bacteroidia bacterium]MDW8334221.1 response regulator [Bacteroidia bacterium]